MKREKNIVFAAHASLDWCHLCEELNESCVDVFCDGYRKYYKDMKYFRICRNCVKKILEADKSAAGET